MIGSIRRECVDHIIVLSEAHLRRILKFYARYYLATITRRGRTWPWIRMRRFLARFSEPVWSGHLASWADFITTTPELEFSVHTDPVYPALSVYPQCTRSVPGEAGWARTVRTERLRRSIEGYQNAGAPADWWRLVAFRVYLDQFDAQGIMNGCPLSA